MPQGVQVSQGGQDDQVPIVKGGKDVWKIPPILANGDIREVVFTLA